MSVEVKCLTIEFFLKSHLVISTGTDEKIHKLCNALFAYEDGEPSSEFTNSDDYQKALEYIKLNILKAITIIKREADDSLQEELQQSITEIEAAPTGEKILALIENIAAVTR